MQHADNEEGANGVEFAQKDRHMDKRRVIMVSECTL